jgi:hypothetical protein
VEQGVEPDNPGGFAGLLDELLLQCDGTTVAPGRALDLAVADHDRLAAWIYRHRYSSRLESTRHCRQCGKAFEVAFDLDALDCRDGQSECDQIEGPDGSGAFQLKGGPRFRLPTARDQLATRHLPLDRAREELLRRCVDTEISAAELAEAVERAMELVAPLIAGTMTLECPHCSFQDRGVQFSIQQYLLDALAFERRFLFSEVHQLARAYGWSRGEILAMPTVERQAHVRMVLAETLSG